MLEVVLDGDPLLLVIASWHAIRERLLAQLLILPVPYVEQTTARVPELVDDGRRAMIVLDEELYGLSLSSGEYMLDSPSRACQVRNIVSIPSVQG